MCLLSLLAESHRHWWDYEPAKLLLSYFYSVVSTVENRWIVIHSNIEFFCLFVFCFIRSQLSAAWCILAFISIRWFRCSFFIDFEIASAASQIANDNSRHGDIMFSFVIRKKSLTDCVCVCAWFCCAEAGEGFRMSVVALGRLDLWSFARSLMQSDVKIWLNHARIRAINAFWTRNCNESNSAYEKCCSSSQSEWKKWRQYKTRWCRSRPWYSLSDFKSEKKKRCNAKAIWCTFNRRHMIYRLSIRTDVNYKHENHRMG